MWSTLNIVKWTKDKVQEIYIKEMENEEMLIWILLLLHSAKSFSSTYFIRDCLRFTWIPLWINEQFIQLDLYILLDKFLWPNYSAKVINDHESLSILLIEIILSSLVTFNVNVNIYRNILMSIYICVNIYRKFLK